MDSESYACWKSQNGRMVLLNEREVHTASSLPDHEWRAAEAALKRLAERPGDHGLDVRKLKQVRGGTAYRLRIGDRRWIFTQDHHGVWVICVIHRSDGYRPELIDLIETELAANREIEWLPVARTAS